MMHKMKLRKVNLRNINNALLREKKYQVYSLREVYREVKELELILKKRQNTFL